MGVPILVLDHGYVEVIEAWGRGRESHLRPAEPTAFDDPFQYPDYEVAIIEAARMSTQGGFKGWDTDKKLLRTLFHHQKNQSTPFEAAGMTIEVLLPIFVVREWQRHRTQSYNEASARYTKLPDLYYIPALQETIDRMLYAGPNKQAQAIQPTDGTPVPLIAEKFIEQLTAAYEDAEAQYQQFLTWGVPKELARLVMPVGHYTKIRATANLRNWLAFLTLRLDPQAQFEIRQYAEAVSIIVQSYFPRTWEIFHESL